MSLAWIDYSKGPSSSDFVQRDLNRMEHDDFVLNVQQRLNEHTEALPVVKEGVIVGWKIQQRYE